MKARERFDKIMLACRDRMQDEVSALIGKPFKLGEAQFRQVSKEALFADFSGKQVVAHLRLDGDIQGNGCVVVGVKDAIRIGGALIMLPESELESVIAEQQYSEELQDSYGEVANIVCGAATVTFEEQYPKSVRLIRTEQELVVPVKVEIESDKPIADVPYYLMSAPMTLDGHELGNLHLVLPAVPFGLAEDAPKAQPTATESAEAKTAPTPDSAAGPKGEAEAVVERPEDSGRVDEEVGVLERPVEEVEEPGLAAAAAAAAAAPKRDVRKQQKVIDGLLKNSMAKMSDEVSALLGGVLKVTPLTNFAVAKEGFLDQAGGKQIMTRLELRGDRQGEACLFVDVRSAVHLGGSLIMLPESELEETVRNETFSDDARDAYGEVTNIVAGVFTSVFDEQYRAKIGFVKTTIEPVTPVKIDPDSDEVFANKGYYLALGQMEYNGRDLGRLQLLIPAEVVELEELLTAEEEKEAAEASRAATGPGATAKSPGANEPARVRDKPSESVDILLFTDDDNEAGRIAKVLEEQGHVCRILHFKDSVNSVLTPRIQMVFLVMQEVSEQGFGVAIKISSSGLPAPLVAAGPAWTRTLVLKAVKYGASDILITPSSSDDVREKIENNLVKKAA